RSLEGRLVAITASNGKTPATSLIRHILERGGFPVLLAGNTGAPLISRGEATSRATVTVAEMSSFQLETIEALRPDVGLLLNITPDHLDRHATFEDYARAKARIFENQTETDAAIVNADDPAATEYAPARPQVYWFSRMKRVLNGAFLRDDQIVFRRDGRETVLLGRGDIGLRGKHNVENILAATAAALLIGATPAGIAGAGRRFSGGEHRLEFGAETAGGTLYNDSKPTNDDA